MRVQNIVLALRRLRKELLYTVIKVAGLATALSCAFLIYLFIYDELQFDRHNDSPEDLYRVIQLPTEGSDADPSAVTPFPMQPMLADQYSHLISSSARLFNQRVPKISMNYVEGDRQFNERRFFFADSTIFDIIKVEFVQGDPQQALANPDGLVMTRPTAERYFGSDDPIGKVVRFDGRFNLVVTGIIEPLPETSHVQFDMLASIQSLRGLYQGGIPETWEWSIVWTYVRANDGVSNEQLNQGLRTLTEDISGMRTGSPIIYEAQPLTDIRLHSDLYAEIGPTSNMQYITILGYIALFILSIAGINFVNLSLAASGSRTLEVGMRKVLGADRKQIFSQYIGEALLTGFISLLAAVVLILIVMPWFGSVTGRSAGFEVFLQGDFWLFAVGVTVLVAGIAGAYPAIILSSWSPLELFKGQRSGSGTSSRLSKALIVVQFGVAAFLISGTWIVYNQLDYMKNQRLGFDHEQTVVIPVAFTRMIFFFDAFIQQTEQHASVRKVIGVSEVIGSENQNFSYSVEGYQNGEEVTFPFYFATEGFEELLGLNLVAGRSFRDDFSTDTMESIIVNEQFVQRVGWGSAENAIGKQIRRDDMRFQVIGVLRDFNFASLHQDVEPLLIELPKVVPSQLGYSMIKLEAGNPADALAWIEEQWYDLDPNRPFEFFYLDDRIQQLYEDEQKLANVAGFFSIIAIIISCFGLFGLASYTTIRRARSIGIRKVLGASVGNLVYILSKEFLLLVFVANLIALPIIYYLMGKWLEGFAYRISIGLEVIIITVVTTILIAFISVAWQTVRAATRNPVESIRYE
ncbi:MAG: ABC transporter permease [Balneolales bacterium]|nr:ABC transporter permease [Balneolales bacterium]